MANTETDLEAPLIEEVSKQPDNADGDCDHHASLFQQRNVLAFGTGVFVGLITEVLLSATLWDSSILSKPIKDLVVFSLVWSVLTTLLVNLSMSIFLRDIKASCCDNAGSWKQVRMAMEGCCIGGALCSISIWWLFLDYMNIILPLSPNAVAATVVVSTLLYLLFLAIVLPQKATSARTSYVLSCLFGLVIGFWSQMVLSALIWSSFLPQAASQNLVLFSFSWSACTVGITFCGCVVLRSFKPSAETNDKDTQMATERAYLRMESAYVLCSLIGICFAWIALDLFLGMPSQIVPSFLMLLMSLIVFRAILYFFPEDQCVDELCQQDNSDTEEVKEEA